MPDCDSDASIAAEWENELAALLRGDEPAPWLTRDQCVVYAAMVLYRYHLTGKIEG